jgi:hypothetical protein
VERLGTIQATVAAEYSPRLKTWKSVGPSVGPHPPLPPSALGSFERVPGVLDDSGLQELLAVDPAIAEAWAARRKARDEAERLRREEERRRREEEERLYQEWLNTPVDWWWHNITFSGGVPVGGWARLKMYRNGAYEFAGHFHDSGASSHDVQLAWVVTTPTHALTFQKEGHMAGTFEKGSRDFDWYVAETNPNIAQHWEDIRNNGGWSGRATVSFDVGALVQVVIQAFGYFVTVIKIVG